MNEFNLREVVFIGSAYRDLKAMPEPVRREIGYALYRAQEGFTHHKAKALKGLPGVLEITSDHNTDTFRGVYTVQMEKAIYVLHVFQKKSKRGKSTPKQDLGLILHRLQEVRKRA